MSSSSQEDSAKSIASSKITEDVSRQNVKPAVDDALNDPQPKTNTDTSELSADSSTDEEASDSEQAEKKAHVPGEIWLEILSYLPKKDLKNARLVKAAFAEFATKALFSSTTFSLEPANIRTLKLLAKSELRKHIKSLSFDTTTYNVPTEPQRYCKLAASYFSFVFAMGSQSTGPLSEDSLHTLLLTDPYKPLGHSFLSGKPRRDFCAGYTLYSARGHYLRDFFGPKNKDLHKLLKQITSSFPNLKSIQSTPYWTESDEPYQARFGMYLRRHLPQKTLDLIPGFSPRLKSSSDSEGSVMGAYAVPGVAARDLNVLMLPPNFGVCYHDTQMHYITRAMLCALKDNKMTLDCLSLPGPDFLGQDCDAKDRSGIVALETLVGFVDDTDIGKRTGLLLPTLRRLKVLELNIDFKQTLRPGMMPPTKEKNRLRHAIQQMKDLESLSLGCPVSLVGDPEAWSLTDLLLWKKADYPEQEEEEDGNPPPPPGAPAFMNMLMNGIAGLVAGGPPGGPPPPPTQPATAPSTAPTPNNPNGSAAPTAGQAPAAAGNFLAQLVGGGVTAVNAQGNVVQQPMNMAAVNALLSGSNLDEPKATVIPDTPLYPNPWPKLRYLSLWNLPSYPEEISRLVKTVKSSLRTLKLSRVYFARPQSLIEADDDQADLLFNLGLGPPPPANGPAGTNPLASSGDSDDDEPSDVPDLVDMVEMGQFQLPSFNSIAAASATDATSSGPASGTPAATNGGLQSNAVDESEEDGEDGNTSKKWLSAIEMLADELRLEACQVHFEEHDEAWLRLRLEKVVTKLPKRALGKTVGPYLLEGDGMGMTMYLAQKHAEGVANDDSEDVADHDKAAKRLNTHVCSIFMACPDGRNGSK